MALKNVVALVLPGVSPFELGVACEGFGIDRSDDGGPKFDFAVVSMEPGTPIPTSLGWTITTEHGLDRAATAELIVAPAVPRTETYPEPILAVLRDAVARGARVMSICSGAYVLAAAGLLDGRQCTTHWKYADDLAARYPKAMVDCDVLYVEDGPVYTSAGTAAGLDLCLHIIRCEYGAAAANVAARRMVMPPHRSGGQAQYVPSVMPVDTDCPMGELLNELLDELEQEHTVDSLAARMLMSPRTFARRFRDETGATPYAWLLRQRVLRAQQLLEGTDAPIEEIARSCGFGNATALRHHFGRAVGTTPMGYRRTFRAA